ncbi:MAG TPA: prolyl oligopeptidase family serine peptidase [Steroidobacteraceae bacterium]|nr:prolyl oligopeptidase family serine peptidase [Steroidobacteraceae bacterium]
MRPFIPPVLCALLATCCTAMADPGAAPAGSPGSAASAADPYLWLEDVHGRRAMAWVHAENARTLAVLEKDPRYAGLYRDALAIAQATDRIPMPSFLDGAIYNFWQDAQHVRGLWRRTTAADYATPAPHWTTVLDLDALAAAEKANWFLHGVIASASERRVLLDLSDGGEDATTMREFAVSSASFPPKAFVLPRGKQSAAWVTDDTVLVSRQWQPGELTASGYPYVVKVLHRWNTLAQAREVFRGTASDVSVDPIALQDGSGHRAVLINRGVTFFESEYYAVKGTGGDRVIRLALPMKLDIEALIDDQLILLLAQDWTTDGSTFKQGSLIAIDWSQALASPQHLHPVLLRAPGRRESIESAAATHNTLLVTALDNVRGRAYLYRHEGGAWRSQRLNLPDNATIDIVDTDVHGDGAFLEVTGFLQPSSLWSVDAAGGVRRIKSLPPRFDASNEVVEQFEAASSDGTRIPYFVVHPRGMKHDGSNPTILYAYGGFQVSETPAYSGMLGKLWLEKGGVYVLANIRGGGEFGPAWHEAGLKTHRQIIYDDFAAVARDLIARGITSTRRLGIQGGSNGGLLMGVEFTQHPELWRAVDIQVPLLDMQRYEKIEAGASWVGEYGSMSNPTEAAFLTKISPYANIRRGIAYPLPFIWTTTKDDRVGPQHARKFAARLKEYGIPYLFYEVTEGGHGAGANLQEKAHTVALEMTYFARRLMD